MPDIHPRFNGSAVPVRLDAAWVQSVLRHTGVLGGSTTVDAVALETVPAINSTIERVRLSISGGGGERIPASLFAKRKTDRAGCAEVAFHRRLAADGATHRTWLPRVLFAACDGRTGESLLLCEDYQATHEPPVPPRGHISGRGLPTARALDQVLRALAGLHAEWWEHDALCGPEAPFRCNENWSDADAVATFAADKRTEWEAFIAKEGVWFRRDDRELCRRLVDAMPRLAADYLLPRFESRRAITLTNGDCYFSQFLCPRDADSNAPALLVDFDSVCTDLPTYDLAFLLAAFWTPPQRHHNDRERKALQTYHDELQRLGVGTYSFDQLMEDYRLAVLLKLLHAIWDHSYQGSDAHYWWLKMQCLLYACHDLESAALLD